MKFLKNGVFTSIQDAGRFGFQSIGVNCGGAMDYLSFKLLNVLLRNEINEAALEMHFPAPVLEFEESCYFAITGADFEPILNKETVVRNKIYFAKSGDILSFKKKIEGERLYFGVMGGFQLPEWLNSKSANLQLGFQKLPNEIKLKNTNGVDQSKINHGIAFDYNLSNNKIRFVPSFEYHKLDESSKLNLKDSEFLITNNSNRMGYRLSGTPLFLNEKEEMVSASVSKGTIQLLPDGQIIVLMADAQVSGGYPKLGFVIENDVSKLAQTGAMTKIQLEIVTYEHAVEIMLQTEKSINLIKKSLKLREIEN